MSFSNWLGLRQLPQIGSKQSGVLTSLMLLYCPLASVLLSPSLVTTPRRGLRCKLCPAQLLVPSRLSWADKQLLMAQGSAKRMWEDELSLLHLLAHERLRNLCCFNFCVGRQIKIKELSLVLIDKSLFWGSGTPVY